MERNDRDRLILECPEKMCDSCCNFDKEHIGMDGTALCKLTMTLAYAEDYGGNCMFYNVPKEQIIVPPCKVGDKVYTYGARRVKEWKITFVGKNSRGEHKIIAADDEFKNMLEFWDYDIGKTVFLAREEAEAELRKRGVSNAEI